MCFFMTTLSCSESVMNVLLLLYITYNTVCITIWLFNIAMENDPFIDGLPIKNCDFLWLC